MTTTNQQLSLGQVQYRAINALYSSRNYKQAGITLRRAKGMTTALFEGQEILKLAGIFSRELFGIALKAQVDQYQIAVMLEVDKVLRKKLVVPADHQYAQNIDNTTRFPMFIHSNHSAYVRHDSHDHNRADQVHAEFRIFMDEPRATLWLSYGPQINFSAVNLLDGRAVHLKADTYAELAEQIVARFAEGMKNLEALKATAAAAA